MELVGEEMNEEGERNFGKGRENSIMYSFGKYVCKRMII